MAHTNSTTHYGYPQFIGTDKPGWLTDVNTAYSNIDGDIYTAQTKADNAYTLADTADGKADNAQTTANTAVTNAGTANTNIGTMANLETTEKTNLVGAINEVNGEISSIKNSISNIDSRFNFTSFKHYDNINDTTNVTVNTNFTFSKFDVYVATNAEGSVFKVYGEVRYNTTATSTNTVTLKNTGIVPDGTFDVAGCGFVYDVSQKTVYSNDFSVSANGDIVLNMGSADSIYNRRRLYIACTYFAKSFGDTPSPE